MKSVKTKPRVGAQGAAPGLPARRLNRRACVAVLCCLAVGGGTAYQGVRAWQETEQRNAYLPDLEAQAARFPSDARLLSLLGGRQAEAGEFDRAAQTLEQAVGAGATDPAVWLTWASCRAAEGKTDEAGRILRYGAGSGRCSEPAALRAALTRYEAVVAEPNVAPSAVAHAVSPAGTGLIASRFGKGSFLNRLSDWRDAREPVHSGFAWRQHEATRHANDAAALTRWAEALRRNRRLREAETAAKRAVSLNPQSPEAQLELGNILYAGNAKASAGLRYKEALRLRPEWIPALAGLGNVAVDKELYNLAVDCFERVTKAEPRNADAWIGLGRSYLNQHFRYDKAEVSFEQAAQLAPKRTDFFVFWSDTLQARYKPAQAEALLRRRLADAPNDARVLFLLAVLLTNEQQTPERTQEAERLLRASIDIEPHAPAAKIRLARLLLEKGGDDNAADAGILLTEALDDDPRDATAMRLLVQAYRRIGRPDRAKEAEQKATGLSRYNDRVAALEDRERNNPRDPKIHQALADLYTSGGETVKAQRQAEMAYMLIHHREAAEKGLETLTRATGHAVSASEAETARGKGTATGAVTP